jgi:flagellin
MSALTIQTNISSLIAEQNLDQTNLFQQNTIQALTSGYRINSSGDDPAGLAVANQYDAEVAELTQGVSNANDGLSTLQIVDGGLSNISSILNQLQSLATEAASGTFAGSRDTLNQNYQQLVSEITQQASNIGLNANGVNNTVLNVFIGGNNVFAGDGAQNGQVTINLSGANNGVDAASLGLSTTSLLGGGSEFGNTANPNTVNNLNNPNALFDVGADTDSETFTVSYLNSQGQIASTPLTIAGTANGQTGTAIVNSLNSQLQSAGATGISAQIGSDGQLQFAGSNLLSVSYANSGLTSPTVNVTGNATPTLLNNANYTATGQFSDFVSGEPGDTDTTETFQLTAGGQNYSISLDSENAGSIQNAVTQINRDLVGSGVTAIQNGTSISLESPNAFTLSQTSFNSDTQATGDFGTGGWFTGASTAQASATATNFGTSGAQTVADPLQSAASDTANAAIAVSAITAAIQQLGLTQGLVGAGEQDLNYATDLANSQITNVSAAESRIRDADMAVEAANLTKAQTLEQAGLAALAQANAAPANVLVLLKAS